MMQANSYHKAISFRQLIRLQALQFTKKKINWLILLLFLCAGLYALHQGYAARRARTATIQAFRGQSDSLLQAMKAGISADTSTAEGNAAYNKSVGLNSGLWNTRLPSFKEPVSTAIYNIGQSDVFTYYYLFTAENFEMQWLKQTEIANPLRSLAGHFDVSFWIVYLLPLMILLLSFNALSEERDNGNWRLIAAQGITEKAWLQSRLIVVGVSASVLLLIIAVAGTLLNGIVFGQGIALSDALFFASSFLYLSFWLSLYFFINSLRRTTTYNALVSGVAWIGLCLVLPVLISKMGEAAIPVDNTRISNFSRRPQDPRLDADKAFAANYIQRLAAQDTIYRKANADTLSPAFYLRTYHAWHLLLHKERWPLVQDYFRQVQKRQQLTNLSTLINPAASTDGYLTALADNDAEAFHHFTEETARLHDRLHQAMLPSLFTGTSFRREDYGRLPAFSYSRNTLPLSLMVYGVFIMALCAGLWIMALNRLKQMQ